jgi:hypothetical protein
VALRGSTRPDAAGAGVPRATRLLLLGVALLTLALYLVSARGIVLTYDEHIMFETTAALSKGKATITKPEVIYRLPGLAVKRPDGKRAGIYGIGTSVAALPMYEAGKLVSHLAPKPKRYAVIANTTLFTNSLLTAATVFVLMLTCLLLGAPPAGAVLIGLAYGVGSYAYPHTATLFTEPGTALLVVTAAYFAFRAARTERRADLVLCGVCAATALLFRASAVLFLPLFGVFCVAAGVRANTMRRGVEWGAWYTAGAVGPLLLLLGVNWWRYGDPTNLGYTYGKATGQNYPILRGLAGQWLSSGKSLFLYAPIVIVVVVGLWWALRRAPMELCLLGSIVLANTLFFARVEFWSGDWAWGPRYMQIVLPCLAAMAAPLMVSRLWRRAVLAVGALGLVFSALPAVLIRFTYLFTTAYSVMPPDRPAGGPSDWDHSYYALIWHTRRFQPILWHLHRIPRAFANALNGSNPRVRPMRIELWWLRPSAYGWESVLWFWALPAVAAIAGIWMLSRYATVRAESAAPPQPAPSEVPATVE